MREEAVLFGSASPLVAVLTEPDDAGRDPAAPGIVLLNSGIIHRVGPNRLYVKMARRLADLGFTVFRFDFSGIGDSGAREDNLPFEKCVVSETQEAMGYLSERRGLSRFVLGGICSGAVAAFMTACADPRVVGGCLINGDNYLYGDDEVSQYVGTRALAHHYWRLTSASSFRRKNWSKVVTGRVNYWRLVRFIAGFQLGRLSARGRRLRSRVQKASADLRALADRGVRLLLVHSEGDEGLDHLCLVFGDELDRLRAAGQAELEIIPGTNHMFTPLWSQARLLEIVCAWAAALPRDPSRPAGPAGPAGSWRRIQHGTG